MASLAVLLHTTNSYPRPDCASAICHHRLASAAIPEVLLAGRLNLQCLLLPPPHIKVAPIGRSLAYSSLEIYVLRLPTPGELSYLQLKRLARKISGSHFCRYLPRRRVLISIQRTVNEEGRAEDRFYYLRIIKNAVDNLMASAFLYGCNLDGFRCLLLYSSGRRVG